MKIYENVHFIYFVCVLETIDVFALFLYDIGRDANLHFEFTIVDEFTCF